MEEYEKKITKRKEHKPKEPWVIFVSQGCKMRNVIPYCLKMLSVHQKIVLCGTGSQLSKAISITEIVKRKYKGIVQETVLTYTEFQDQWEPKNKTKGLDNLSVTRHIPTITITLSLDGDEKAPVAAANSISRETLAELKRELKSNLRDMAQSKAD